MRNSGDRQREEEVSVPTEISWLPASLYFVAFITGAIVMSFEMLGSRYLAPYFGAGIYTWASLISTVLAALCAGYFLGGLIADRWPFPLVLGSTVTIGSIYLVVLPLFADPILQFLVWHIDDIRWGSLASALAIIWFPVTLLGMYSPFAIRLLLRSKHKSGVVSGAVYGVSTAGSILGTLGTTFVLIPLIGSRAITLALGIAGIAAGALLAALGFFQRGSRVGIGAFAGLLAANVLLASVPPVRAEDGFDRQLRAAMLEHKDGLVVHKETVYNDIFVTKRRNVLRMAFHWKGWHFPETEINLDDPDDLPMAYARVITVSAIYPDEIGRVLILGLGGGALATYFSRFLPEATIDTVEIDPGVIEVAKKHFGFRETGKSRVFDSDGRVFLNRHPEPYDLILVDAFTGSYIPFHLLTKEFYQLVRNRLGPHGATAFNFAAPGTDIPGTRLYDSSLRTLSSVFQRIDLYHSGEEEVIAVAALDSPDPETLGRKAAAAQDRHRFRFDVTKLLSERRIDFPKDPKGQIFTDDFAPASLQDAASRRYRRESSEKQ
jgi:predicted membrane-bound spermidine synthase